MTKPGSYFRFKNDPTLFSVQKASNLLVLHEFEIINGPTIKIESDVGIDISVGDEILISHKEYELITVFQIKNKGTGYKIGDKLKLDAEFPNMDVINGLMDYATLEVTEVDKTGGILKININSKGKYFKEPQNELGVIGSLGKGALFEVAFKEMDTKKLIERQVEFIEYNIPCTIYLNAPIPNGVTKGRLSIDKWELFLSANYDKNLINIEYEIIQDFTSHLGLPLLAQNSFSKDSVINKSFHILDARIKELEEQIQKLISVK